jgi:hypothetical protein
MSETPTPFNLSAFENHLLLTVILVLVAVGLAVAIGLIILHLWKKR